MFGTIIMDSYKADEAESMSQNIDEIWIPLAGLRREYIPFGIIIPKMFFTLV